LTGNQEASMNSKNLTLLQRVGIVVATVLGVFAIAFCAAVFTVIFLHADKEGMLPPALSLRPLGLSEPTIKIVPKPVPPGAGQNDKLINI
jgi:hypothetical protein